jgi:hypothetical protein
MDLLRRVDPNKRLFKAANCTIGRDELSREVGRELPWTGALCPLREQEAGDMPGKAMGAPPPGGAPIVDERVTGRC